MKEKITKEEFIQKAKIILNPLFSDVKGEVIYSPADTFKKGKYYFLGLNPGNYPKDTCPFSEYPTIKTHLDGFLNNQNIPDYYEIALGNIKNNVKKIFSDECLNCKLENLFTTNLIFRQTNNADELKNYLNDANLCWQFHELALQEIDPEIIVTCGNGEFRSAYSYIFIKCNGKEIYSQELYNSYKIKIAEIIINNKKKLLLGLPHLSRISGDKLKNCLIDLKNNGKFEI